VSRDPDDDLRRLLGEARQKDERAAPPFRRILELHRAARPGTPRRIRWIVVATVGAAIVAGVLSTHRLPSRSEASLGRIEAWRPPTAFLLETSFRGLFDTTPTLARPVPDYSPLLAREKGNRS